MEAKIQSADVVIVGGGIMGSSTAYYLTKADPRLRVVVVEKDPAYQYASTTLSMANVRIQFSLKENILVSMYAMKVLENFEKEMAVEDRRPAIAFRREGNLFIVGAAGEKVARQAYQLQKELGCDIQWWDPAQIKEHYPLYAAEGYLGGTFGPGDGHFDAYGVLMGYRSKAKSQGAVYLEGEVKSLEVRRAKMEAVHLASSRRLATGIVINCAGAWCCQVAETAGVRLPVKPVMRQVFALDSAVKPEGPLPLTVLPSGLYFRTETGGLILLGKSMDQDRVGFDFSWDDNRFYEVLWPELYQFVPAFDRLKLVRGWAGLYAVNTLDGNAIVGPWPEIEGLYLANGFSGHGLQQAPAVGRYLAEIILDLPLSLDLSVFDPARIIAGKPIAEAGLV